MKVMKRLRKFWGESKRLLRVTKKPDREEYKLIAKVSAVGILIIGLMGFFLFLVREFVGRELLTLGVIVLILVIMFIKRDD